MKLVTLEECSGGNCLPGWMPPPLYPFAFQSQLMPHKHTGPKSLVSLYLQMTPRCRIFNNHNYKLVTVNAVMKK